LEKQDMNTTDNDGKPRLLIKDYEVIAENCTDKVTAISLAEQAISEIDQQLAKVKAQKTQLNSTRHILSQWLRKQLNAQTGQSQDQSIQPLRA
jgi:hypothetical protein